MQTPSRHMHISMDHTATPHQEVVARRIPLRYKPQTDTVVQDLINKNVITKVDVPTKWVSPAFFVPKPDGIRMRLVTDYTKLNKYVHRPIHPFPSTRDIMQSIPHGQKIFAKLGAVHGYFQLALDEESSYLTTFLLPQGRFRYLRAPMGLNASSDEWCRHSDVAVEGLDWCMKIVDDIIIWATTNEEMWSRINIVLERCKNHNITISRKKLEIGEEIEFA